MGAAHTKIYSQSGQAKLPQVCAVGSDTLWVNLANIFQTRLLRNFFFSSLLIPLISYCFVVLYIIPSFNLLLTANIEDEALRTAKLLNDSVMAGKAELTKGSFSKENIHDINHLVRDFRIEKLKIFSKQGEIIYSTAPENIGEINTNDYFQNIIAKGKVYSRIAGKNTKTMEGRTVRVDVVEAYVPLLVDGVFIAILEIYFDISAEKVTQVHLLKNIYAVQFAIIFIFMISVIFILFKSSMFILERDRAKLLLSRSETKFRTLFDSTSAAVILLDEQGIFDCNEATLRYFGCGTRDAFCQLKPGSLSPPLQPCGTDSALLSRQFIATALEKGSLHFEWLHKRIETDDTFPSEVLLTAMALDGKPFVQAVIRDITEARQAAAELEKIRQQQIELKDNFLSHVSHELRTPLTVIHQFVSILQDKIPGSLNDEQQQYLAITMRNITALRGMIDDLLESCRAQTGKLAIEPQVISLREVVGEVISQYLNRADEKPVLLSSHIAVDYPGLYADPQRTRQILTNLIDNAIKFSPDNCTISIGAHVYEEDTGFLCVTVADKGVGIPPDRIEQIFEQLYQVGSNFEATRKGLGLGLYICKDLVSRHGGRIWAESQVGQWTTFSFTLPFFSYVNLLQPILTKENLESGLQLVTIEALTIKKGIAANLEEISLTEVWRVLNRCVLPDLDVILPRVGRLNGGEIFYLAACTDEKGVEILKKRVRSQIDKAATVHGVITTKVSSAMIAVAAIENDTDFDKLAMSVSESVKDIVQGTLSRKRMCYEENSHSR